MKEELDDIGSVAKHWLDSSKQNYSTMQNLLNSKDYDWAMFMGHLVIENLLKALYVKKNSTHAVFTHDLLRLATKCDLEISDQFEEWLDDLTTFNINARYDSYKQNFRKRCTPEFTKIWTERIEILKEWLNSQF